MLASYKYGYTATSALIKTGPGKLHSVILTAAGDAATLIVYDNTAGSGTIICKLGAATTETSSAVLDVAFGTGIYAAVTGTTPSATLSFA